MGNRYSRPRQRSWLVPAIVVVGVAGFFLWESGWRPFEVVDVPSGSLDSQAETADAATRGSLGLPDVHPQSAEPATLSEDDLMLPVSKELAAGQSEPVVAIAERPQFEPAPAAGEFGPGEIDARPPAFDANQFEPAEFEPPPTMTGSEVRQASATAPDRPERTATARQRQQPPAPAAITAELRSKLNKIDFLLEENDYLTAHRDLSAIYWYEPQFRHVIGQRIEKTARAIYADKQPHFMEPHVMQPGGTLSEVAEQYNVPWRYLERLNRVSADRVRAGAKLKVIRGPFGAVVDLSDFEITIHSHGYYVASYKIGIGQKGQSTPIGEFKVGEKLENPTYYPQGEPVVSADDPKNPLGEHWLSIGDGYGIHGTIDPGSIGRAASKGCIRMRNEDIEQVYDMLSVGSTVLIRR